MMEPLLAKSGKDAPTLEQHLQDVADTATLMFGKTASTRLCRSWLRFFRHEEVMFKRFAATLHAAATLHDWGKANDGFQDAVRRNGDQAIRHEHLSALLIHHEPMWKWLTSDKSVDWEIVLSAVLTHHQKCLNATAIASLSDWRKNILTPVDSSLIQFLPRLLGRESVMPAWPAAWTFDSDCPGLTLKSEIQRLDDALYAFDGALDRDAHRNRLLRAVRAALICADAAGSGLRRQGLSLETWLTDQFDESHAAICDPKYIGDNIIEKRLADLRNKGKWEKWHEFQLGASTHPSRTLLLAPCGAGKTLAAWKWIQEQAKAPVKRVIFLYPTRATATEGFKDYVSYAPEADASLIHGTGAYELDGMFENPPLPDDRSEKKFGVEPRLFSLGYWSKRVFSGTVDQFLAFLHHAYGPTCLLPVLVDSIVVIDEVHSFDPAMFSSLKAFLQEFNVPVLCMTATLLRAQRHQLENRCGMTVYEDRPEDLAKIADAPRYQVKVVSQGEVKGIIKRALAEKKRVLWVVNKVAIAQATAREFGTVERDGGLCTAEGVRVLCYHSRFTLDDRKARHRQVVDAFKPPKDAPPGAILAVTTQVCEMSLDLDADVLVTELCPVSSMVQRMGRCNRKSCVPPSVGEVYVYVPENEKPYEKDDISSATDFVNALTESGEPVSQTDLERTLQIHGRKPPQGDRPIPFISTDPYADGRNDPFRDIEEHCVQGLLDEAAYVAADRLKRPGLIVPVPRKLRPQPCTHRDARRLVVAPVENYHHALGLCDEPIGEQP